MTTVVDDLQEPDETRPAKRVRLEAPLDTTEEMEEEIIDDEDLYGIDAEGNAAQTVVDEPSLKPAVNEDVAHELPNTVTMSESGVQANSNGSATPKTGGEDVMDTEDLYGEDKGETADGLPAAAIDHGDSDFVAPPQHIDGEDGIEEAIIDETSRVEVEPPVEFETPAHGEPKAAAVATDQKKEKASPQPVEETASVSNFESHVAPARSRPDNTAALEREDEEEVDFYEGLEAAMKAKDAAATPVDSSEGRANTAKPKKDTEFLEAAAAQKSNEAAEWQFDSSDAESSSDDSSDSSDSDSDSDSGSEGGYEMLDPETAAKILMSGDGEDEGGKEKGDGGGGPRTANEVKYEVAPKPDVKVTEDMQITLLGTVDRIVENMALIRGATPGEYQVLESGSVLCSSSREVIGEVAETFGRVQEPMYSIAFSNPKEIEDMGMVYGTQVYYVDAHSKFVFTQPLKGMKGTDASNIHDEEIGEDELEFSDDEKEAEFKRMKKAAKRGGRGGLTRTEFNSASRGGMHSFGAPGHDGGHTFVGGGASDAPQTTYGGGMSYDDEDVEDGFYQPLKRPDNLSELMAGRPPPPPPQRGGSDRGRGRGRGRGDRGRGDRGRGRGGFNQRGQRGGSFGGENSRGGRDQTSGHRGSAHSFPDRHNNNPKNRGRGQHSLPSKAHSQQSPTPPQSSPQQQYQQYPPFPPAPPPPQQSQVPPSPQTYQFNGYTFQYGNPPPPTPTQYQQPPQQQQQYTSNYPNYYQQQASQQQQSPGAQFPAGAYVNPAFWTGQGQQQQQAQQYGAWAGQQPQYGQYQGQTLGQQGDLANLLKRLGEQG